LVVLEVGCGCFPVFSDSVTCDIDSRVRPVVVCDCHFLPFVDGVFGVVDMREVVEHLRSPFDVLCEVRRVLCVGGCLFLSTPNLRFLGFVFGRSGVVGHVFGWRDVELCNLFLLVGFVGVEVFYGDLVRFWRKSFLRFFSGRFGCHHLFVVGVK
jgi:SAM-dependent methyltransferase